MLFAAPISAVGFVRVEAESLGGTVNDRFMAMRLGVLFCSGVEGAVAEAMLAILKERYPHAIAARSAADSGGDGLPFPW